MKTAEIVALIASIFTAISGISAAIACFLTYRTTRPKIKLKISKYQSNRIYMHAGDKSFALLGVEIINSSSISGALDDLWITYGGKNYHAETIYTNFDTKPFEIKSFLDEKLEQDINSLRLKTPLRIEGYSIISGFFIFPTFLPVQTHVLSVKIRYRLADKKFKREISRVKFFLSTPDPIKKNQK